MQTGYLGYVLSMPRCKMAQKSDGCPEVVEDVCSPTEEFEADPAYTSNDLCVAGRIARLERDVVELRGDSALDRAYMRGLASVVYGERENAVESLRSQIRALQEAIACRRCACQRSAT